MDVRANRASKKNKILGLYVVVPIGFHNAFCHTHLRNKKGLKWPQQHREFAKEHKLTAAQLEWRVCIRNKIIRILIVKCLGPEIRWCFQQKISWSCQANHYPERTGGWALWQCDNKHSTKNWSHEALDLLVVSKGSFAAANTSQVVKRMHCIDDGAPMMTITCFPQTFILNRSHTKQVLWGHRAHTFSLASSAIWQEAWPEQLMQGNTIYGYRKKQRE